MNITLDKFFSTLSTTRKELTTANSLGVEILVDEVDAGVDCDAAEHDEGGRVGREQV